MQDWETMIAERVAAHGVVVTCREQDPRRRNRQAYDRRHDKTPKRVAQHKAWAKSSAGKKSMRERGARYRATEKGRLNALKKSRAYFDRHKDDPAWRTTPSAGSLSRTRKSASARVAPNGVQYLENFTL